MSYNETRVEPADNELGYMIINLWNDGSWRDEDGNVVREAPRNPLGLEDQEIDMEDDRDVVERIVDETYEEARRLRVPQPQRTPWHTTPPTWAIGNTVATGQGIGNPRQPRYRVSGEHVPWSREYRVTVRSLDNPTRVQGVAIQYELIEDQQYDHIRRLLEGLEAHRHIPENVWGAMLVAAVRHEAYEWTTVRHFEGFQVPQELRDDTTTGAFDRVMRQQVEEARRMVERNATNTIAGTPLTREMLDEARQAMRDAPRVTNTPMPNTPRYVGQMGEGVHTYVTGGGIRMTRVVTRDEVREEYGLTPLVETPMYDEADGPFHDEE